MSMAKVFSGKLGNGAIVMGPDFTATRDAQGKWTASGEFRVLRGDFERNDVQAKFSPGNSITAISGNALSSAWSFLLIDSVDANDEPGGITVVRVSFTGFTENQWDFDADKNKTYTRTGTTVEKSILDHPLFKDEVTNPQDIESFRMAIAGTWRERDDSTSNTLYLVAANGSDAILNTITDAKAYAWWVEIVRNGNHTFLAPAMEWTESTTGLGKLQASEFSGLGYIDNNVPGSPAAPPDEKWLFTSVTEEIQRQGDGVNSYSRTWTSGKWPTKIYTKP
jgi:hypothetical protein